MGFRGQVLIRVVLIFLLGFTGGYFLLETRHWLVSFWCFLFSTIGIVSLIRYVEHYRRALSSFLVSIKQSDFSSSFLPDTTENKALITAFNLIQKAFMDTRSQKETSYHFLDAVVEHTGVALLSFEESNFKINLMNEAAKEMLDKPFLSSVQGLKMEHPELLSILLTIKSGSQVLLNYRKKGETIPLVVHAKQLVLDQKKHKLLSFHNVKNELNEQELISWHKLMRVIGHEIKNSTIPIATLSEVVLQMLRPEGATIAYKDLDEETILDVIEGIETICKRSEGLVHFVEAYNEFNKIPKPELASVKLKTLLHAMLGLMETQILEKRIVVKTELEYDGFVMADQNLIEQVILNLLKNAVEAISSTDAEQPLLQVKLSANPKGVMVWIEDNGHGIPAENADAIFTPFYTTKHTGSGIGLSISRQIMQLHQGQISLKSSNPGLTRFELQFPYPAK